MYWHNYSNIEGYQENDWEYQDYEKNFQDFFDFEGIFFFLLGILGGVLAVVLGLVIVQQGRECIDWLQRRRRSLSRPPSYNTVSKPPRYSLCGLTPASPTSLYSAPDSEGSPDPPAYSQVFTVEFPRSSHTVPVDVTDFPLAVMDSDDSPSQTRQSQSLTEVPDCSLAGAAPGEETSQEQQRLTSCKSLFSFDSRSRSRYLLASAGCSVHKKSYSLQRFGALSQSSDSESDSAPLLDDCVEL